MISQTNCFRICFFIIFDKQLTCHFPDVVNITPACDYLNYLHFIPYLSILTDMYVFDLCIDWHQKCLHWLLHWLWHCANFYHLLYQSIVSIIHLHQCIGLDRLLYLLAHWHLPIFGNCQQRLNNNSQPFTFIIDIWHFVIMTPYWSFRYASIDFLLINTIRIMLLLYSIVNNRMIS